MTLYQRVVAAYRFLNRWAGPLTLSLFLLVMRVDWGYQFLVTGWGHFHPISNTIDAFKGWGVPSPVINAYFASAMELIGGGLLLLGLFSRPIAALLTVQMLVAFVTPPGDRALFIGFFDPNNNTPANIMNGTPFFFLVMTVLVFALGPGWFSIDALLKRFVFGSARDETPRDFG